MARPTTNGVNKSQAIRDLLRENPTIKGKVAIATLAKKGIDIKYNLFQFVKGSVEGGTKKQHPARQQSASSSDSARKSGDTLSTIRMVKSLAADVGGLRTLKQIVDALSD